MGPDQSKDRSPERDIFNEIPYTSFGVTPPSQPGRSRSRYDDDIITVRRGGTPSRGDALGDAHLRELNTLPQRPPILQDSLEDQYRFSGFGSRKEQETRETAPNLDFVNDKPLVDALAEFQTNSMRKGCVLVNTQQVVLSRVDEVQQLAQTVREATYRRFETLRKIESALRDVEGIEATARRAERSVDTILQQVELLSRLIPAKVKENLTIPLPPPIPEN